MLEHRARTFLLRPFVIYPAFFARPPRAEPQPGRNIALSKRPISTIAKNIWPHLPTVSALGR
jgi:hypothetical protein